MSNSQAEISQIIKQEIASILSVQPAQVDENTDIDRFALNSSSVVSLVGILEEQLDMPLSPSLFFEYPTIAKTAEFLAKQVARQQEIA